MKPNYYIDFTVDGDEDTASHALLPQVYRILHGAFGKSGNNFAVSFPSSKNGKSRTVGNIIRIFSSEENDLKWLLINIKDHFIIRDYTKIGDINKSPVNSKWATWARVRVQKNDGVNRNATIERAINNPFFEIVSQSGHGFALRFSKLIGSPQLNDCQPNSYGLASGGNRRGDGANLFSLPDF